MQMNREWWGSKFKVESSKAWTERMTRNIDLQFKVQLLCSSIENSDSTAYTLSETLNKNGFYLEI